MFDGMNFNRKPLLQPFVRLLVRYWNGSSHDRNRGTSIDLFKAVQDRTQKGLVLGGLSHVVDGQDDDCLDALFTDPLRGHQFRKMSSNIEWISAVEIGKPVCFRSLEQISRLQRLRSERDQGD